MKILIVDDNCQMRELMRIYSQGIATDIRECCDGSVSGACSTTCEPAVRMKRAAVGTRFDTPRRFKNQSD